MSLKLADKTQPFCLKKCLKAYLLFMLVSPLHIYNSLSVKDFWSLLFISCLALYIPILWIACGLFLCFKIFTQIQLNNLVAQENIQCFIVSTVELNQLEKLSDAIEANPDILYCVYQRRSLIAWCRYYKNTRAQELIMQMMIKYPKEKEAVAA